MSSNNLKRQFYKKDNDNIKDISTDKNALDISEDNTFISTKDVLSNVGANIRKIRKVHKMSINDLANKANMSSKYLQGVEVGKRNISVTNLSKIASVLKIPTSDLFNVYDYARSSKILDIANKLKNYNTNQLDSIEKLIIDIENMPDKSK